VRFALRIGANMRALREACGLTHAAVSGRGGIRQSALVLFESGDAVPDIEQLVRIAGVLGTTPDRILAGVRWDQDQMRLEIEPPPDAAA
jgi:transcriptional regulator with XRE-family HTH domain